MDTPSFPIVIYFFIGTVSEKTPFVKEEMNHHNPEMASLPFISGIHLMIQAASGWNPVRALGR
jgi:hypothetical protein